MYYFQGIDVHIVLHQTPGWHTDIHKRVDIIQYHKTAACVGFVLFMVAVLQTRILSPRRISMCIRLAGDVHLPCKVYYTISRISIGAFL